jgi:hypothetical protein
MDTTAPSILPDVGRPDATFVVSRDFTVERPESLRHSADVLLDAWDDIRWPEGLLSISVFLGTDGITIFHYVQWTNKEAFDEYIALGDPGPAPYIVQMAPELKMSNLAQYTPYRSAPNEARSVPGCIVVVEVEFDGPDYQRQRAWVDAVFEALATDAGGEAGLPEGGLGAHFHTSVDGTRVLNYAEWVDEASHIAALERGGDSIGRGELWDRVQRYPGLKGSTVRRFTPYRLRTG